MSPRLPYVLLMTLALGACSSESGGSGGGSDELDGGANGQLDGAPEPGDDAGGDDGREDAGPGPGDDDAGQDHQGCGNRLLEVQSEECDDGNAEAGDGCDAQCKVETGYACPVVGARCRAAECGDGIIAGDEECEDDDPASGDGCDERCRLEDGFACDDIGQPCRATVCGDGETEGREQCDDGNEAPFDGCYECKLEPSCDDTGCAPVCGDGIKFPAEACDDGNTRSGDGCAADCTLEEGFACSERVEEPPAFVDLPVVYRDFRGFDLPAIPEANIAAGHVDFQHHNQSELGLVTDRLSADKKPVYAKPDGTSATTASAEMFDKWYRDDPEYNRTVASTLRFDRNDEGSYVFLDTTFFPLDEAGFVAEGHEALRTDGDGDPRNFHFTSELRTQFEYKGGESLAFLGDDDVWVFVNNRLALDLGGVHGAQAGSFTLDASGTDARFGLTAGNIYEMVVFQAERHTTRSEYRLTLKDFVRAQTSCESICGDGVLTADEACDDMVNDGGYGECAPGCVFDARCGDGVTQAEFGEECDDNNRDNDDTCTNECKVNIIL